MDETTVKNQLYTPESMACGGEVEQPDDETGDTGEAGDAETPEMTQLIQDRMRKFPMILLKMMMSAVPAMS